MIKYYQIGEKSMKTIGLTGGIGTGKSTVSAYIADKGFPVIDADKIARQIVMPGMPALEAIAERFGCEVINDEDGTLDRKALAAIVFNDEQKRAELNSITLTAICDIIEKELADYKQQSAAALIFIDAPLLFEAGLDRLCDAVWTVDAGLELRVARVAARDGMKREEIMARIKSQLAEADKHRRSSDILDNSGEKEDLYEQIEELIAKYV